jgi:hypothetical protein
MTDGATTAVQTVQQGTAMSLKQVTDRVNLVHKVLETVMKKDTHFGTVPGCGAKMVLLKPGADVLAMTFRLVPQFAVTRTELPDGHREYDVTCSMYGADGAMLGQGVGSASTMEKKYRYRRDAKGNQAENADIADVYNTVLKIAKKRAHIDATLTVTGAADLFTQDLIDEDAEPPKQAPAMPTRKAEPQATQAPAAKPEAKQAPQVAGPVGDTVTGLVEVVTSKPTAKGNKRYGIKVDGVWYNTFSDTDGTTAADCKGAGIPVRIVYVTNAKGYNDIAEGGLTAVQEPSGEQATGGGPADGDGKLPF